MKNNNNILTDIEIHTYMRTKKVGGDKRVVLLCYAIPFVYFSILFSAIP